MLTTRGLAWWLSGSAAAMAGLLSAASPGPRPGLQRWESGDLEPSGNPGSCSQGLLLVLAAALVAFRSLSGPSNSMAEEPSWPAALWLLLAGLVAAAMLHRSRQQVRTQGLAAAAEAAAYYRRELLWTPALLVCLGLAPTRPWLDAAIALAMALYLGGQGGREALLAARARLGRREETVSLDVLCRLARAHPEVVATDGLELREGAGPALLELRLVMDEAVTAERAEAVAEELIRSLRQQLPGAEVLLRMRSAPAPIHHPPLRPRRR